jgi:TPR repeat protein
MRKITLKLTVWMIFINSASATDFYTSGNFEPLIAESQSNQGYLRKRKNMQGDKYLPLIDFHSVQSSTSPTYKLNEEKDDALFSSLGKGWELFKNKDYENAFSPIYHLANKNNPQAQYLLGEIYENGLGKIFKSFKDASKWYTQAIINSNHLSLKKKAGAGLNRTIANSSSENIEETYKLETYFHELSTDEPELEYSREKLRGFLKYLKSHYTYLEIANKTGQLEKSTICKLTIYGNYGSNKDYETFWKSLKKEYSKEYKEFSTHLK